jgi:riboflavin synthase
MFTGIIREVGRVKSITRKGDIIVFEVGCEKTLASSSLGDSVAVNGVCLTVAGKKDSLFFDVVRNTNLNSSFKRLKRGDRVNLENSLAAGDDISGHLVTGHVDGERKVKKNLRLSAGWVLEIVKKSGDSDLVVAKGSVAIDGVSLTVAKDNTEFFSVFLIPYTLKDTTLSEKRSGDYVNVEYDMLGRYAGKSRGKGQDVRDKLKENGFM